MSKEDAIMKMLSESSLGKAVEGRIFPLAASVGTQFPYVVYAQTSRSDFGTKDGDSRVLIVAVSVVSKSYKQSHQLASTVEHVCQKGITITEEAEMYNPEFAQESEMYDPQSDAFMVRTEMAYEYYNE